MALTRAWRDLRACAAVATLVYGLGCLLGASLSPDSTASAPLPEGWVQILLHNLISTLPLVAGVATFGLTTVGSLLVNGLAASHTIMAAIQVYSPGTVLARTLPHGVIELAATVGLASCGLTTAYALIRRVLGLPIPDSLWQSTITGVGASYGLLLLAAWIEGVITLRIAS